MKFAQSLVFFVILSLPSMARAQDRAPHGLVYESPLAFPPQAYDFFHPNAKTPLDEDSLAPLPLAATMQSDVAHERVSTANTDRKARLGASGIAGIVLGAVFVIVSVLAVYYVVTTRLNNLNRTKSAQSPTVDQTV